MANAGYLQAPERRRQILEGAKRVFAARGYHDTNISHICDDLGIARGTLYQYFESKKAVFSAIIEGLLDRVRAAVDETPPLQVPPGLHPTAEQVIRHAARNLKRTLAAVFEDEASLRIVVREAVGLDVQIDAILHAIDDIVIDRCAGDLREAQRAGVLRPDFEPRAAALFLLGGVQKVALDALRRPGAGAMIDLDALADEVTRIQMLGLLAGAGPAT